MISPLSDFGLERNVLLQAYSKYRYRWNIRSRRKSAKSSTVLPADITKLPSWLGLLTIEDVGDAVMLNINLTSL